MDRARRLIALAVFASLLGAAVPVSAQGALVGRVGSSGIGLDAGWALHEKVTLRAAASAFSLQVDWDEDEAVYGVVYEGDLRLRFAGGYVDLHPRSGSFRATAGLVRAANRVEAVASPRVDSFEFNGVVYPASVVGNVRLDGRAGRTWAPYLGIGSGSARGRGRTFFVLDVGLVFHGQPAVALTATGPIASDARFLANLRAEEAETNRDLDELRYRFYPVLSLGLGIRF